MAADAELQERYQRWVDAVLTAGEVWIVGEGDRNTVIEDPDDDRDLNLLFSSRTDAERHADRGEVFTPPLPLGEGLALWQGESWIVAEPAPLAIEIRERTTER